MSEADKKPLVEVTSLWDDHADHVVGYVLELSGGQGQFGFFLNKEDAEEAVENIHEALDVWLQEKGYIQ